MSARRPLAHRRKVAVSIAVALSILAIGSATVVGGIQGERPSEQTVIAADAPLAAPPGTTERVSVRGNATQGNGAGGGVSGILASANANQAISADGRWVAFVSAATNLIPNSPHPAGGVYVRDRQSGATVAVPWLTGGAFPTGISGAEPVISGDGVVVAFTAIVTPGSSNTLPAPTTTPYVLAWDRQANSVAVISADANNQPTPGFQPSISADGRYIAYTQWAVASDTTPPSLSNLNANPTCITAITSTISVTVTDPDDAISSVTIGVTPPGVVGYLDTMTYAGGNVWQATITPNQPTSGWVDGFVDYTVTAHDSHGNSSSASGTHDTSGTNWLYYNSSGTCIIL